MIQVSVIIPCYNSEKYITKAIQSALQQTLTEIEIIVVDDASTDRTVEIVRRYKSDRLQLLVNESNRGPSYSRNRAIAAARGEWIALLDSDDWYAMDRLAQLLEIARAENADFIADDLYLIADSAAKPWGTRFCDRRGFGCRHIRFDRITQLTALDLIELDIGLVKPIVRRDFLLQHHLSFNESERYGEDFLFFFESLIAGARFIIVPQPYYYYRIRPQALTTEYVKCQQQMYTATQNLLKLPLIQEHPQLTDALSLRQAKLQHHLQISLAYNQIRTHLIQKNFATLIAKLWQQPHLFILFILHLFRNLRQRLTTLFTRIIYQKNQAS